MNQSRMRDSLITPSSRTPGPAWRRPSCSAMARPACMPPRRRRGRLEGRRCVALAEGDAAGPGRARGRHVIRVEVASPRGLGACSPRDVGGGVIAPVVAQGGRAAQLRVELLARRRRRLRPGRQFGDRLERSVGRPRAPARRRGGAASPRAAWAERPRPMRLRRCAAPPRARSRQRGLAASSE